VARLTGLLFFLLFVDDEGAAYNMKPASIGAPMGWVNFLIEPTAIKLRPFDLIMLVVLLWASLRGGKGGAPQVKPMKHMLWLMLLTTVACVAYGLARGGDFRHASWQTYLILSTVLAAFTVAATCRTLADFRGLAHWLIAAALYRGIMCWISYFTWGHDLVGSGGAYLTSHEDTVLWVVSILVLLVDAIDRWSPRTILTNGAAIVFFIVAIQWNSRRLAWVSLAMGLAVLYVLFPQGQAKRRINRVARIALPVLLLYVVVGWGRGNRIFLPLRALSTVSTQEDASTLARNAENLGLIFTANNNGYVLGTGWGHPYIHLTMKYDISLFELWEYIPHNSILGLLAFTGFLGFAGFWLAFPTAVFLMARVARLSADARTRSVAMIGSAQLMVCANQLYGDMGIFGLTPMYMMAIAYAIALRLPNLAGVWNAPPGAPTSPVARMST
jgi:hypothetical protein